MLKKKILFYSLILLSSYIFAEGTLNDVVNSFQDYSLKEIKIKSKGTLEYDYIDDSNFEECWIFNTEKINGIEEFFWYPAYNNKVNRKEGKIKINNQIFTSERFGCDLYGAEIYSVNYNDKTYLLFLASVGKYGDKICFIFDITDSQKIIFVELLNKFVPKEIGTNFVRIYQNNLYFLLSTRRNDWNGQYKLIPYFIEDDTLKELCDEKGDPYFIDYSFTTKYEQEYIIEDLNFPEAK